MMTVRNDQFDCILIGCPSLSEREVILPTIVVLRPLGSPPGPLIVWCSDRIWNICPESTSDLIAALVHEWRTSPADSHDRILREIADLSAGPLRTLESGVKSTSEMQETLRAIGAPSLSSLL